MTSPTPAPAAIANLTTPASNRGGRGDARVECGADQGRISACKRYGQVSRGLERCLLLRRQLAARAEPPHRQYDRFFTNLNFFTSARSIAAAMSSEQKRTLASCYAADMSGHAFSHCFTEFAVRCRCNDV
jgi:hypothetical protein